MDERTEHEQEWQPVRIAPAENSFLCGNDEKARNDFSDLKKCEGKIVRVRRVPLKIVDWMGPNDKEAFEVHPDDCPSINAWGGHCFCEHQILAD